MSLITIVHTGDLHDSLTEEKADRLKKLRCSADLLVDSGDAIKSGNIFFNPMGERAHRLMNRAEYDIACVGNREYHLRGFPMKCKLKNALFTFVAANYCWSEGRLFDEYESRLIKGTELFIFGLANVNVSADMRISRWAEQYQTDPVERAEKIVLELEQLHASRRDRVIMALTHIGLELDKEIARRLKGSVAVILGGHSHDSCYGTVGGTHIIHSGCHGEYATRFTYDTETKKITALERISL